MTCTNQCRLNKWRSLSETDLIGDFEIPSSVFLRTASRPKYFWHTLNRMMSEVSKFSVSSVEQRTVIAETFVPIKCRTPAFANVRMLYIFIQRGWLHLHTVCVCMCMVFVCF